MNKDLQPLKVSDYFEEQARASGHAFILGVDEAGRGPLAGPVVAACCFLPKGVYFQGLNDSKQLTEKQRELLFEQITTTKGVQFGIGTVDASRIDEVNILQATIEAMKLALTSLSSLPDYILCDGLSFNYFGIPCQKIIKGDALSFSIAAASVLAKVTRDRLMLSFHEEFPLYGFDQHKGYGTKKHTDAIFRFGPCPIHRKSFAPIKSLNTFCAGV